MASVSHPDDLAVRCGIIVGTVGIDFLDSEASNRMLR